MDIMKDLILNHANEILSPTFFAGILYYMIALQVKLARMSEKIQLYQDNMQDISRQMYGVTKALNKYSALSEQIRCIYSRIEKIEHDVEYLRKGK